jgi:hypothetical protein
MTQHHIDHHDIADGVNAHKDLHVTAVVDTYDRILDTASFPPSLSSCFRAFSIFPDRRHI